MQIFNINQLKKKQMNQLIVFFLLIVASNMIEINPSDSIQAKIKQQLKQCVQNQKNRFCNCQFECLSKNISFLKQILCKRLCGNGKISRNQQCDDGNNKNGDGCSSTCKIQQHFSCTVMQNQVSYCFKDCTIFLYNKMIQYQTFEKYCESQYFSTFCNDFNNIANDGCTNCKVEYGYLPNNKLITFYNQLDSKNLKNRNSILNKQSNLINDQTEKTINNLQYPNIQISHLTKCGNGILDTDDKQICDWSYQNGNCPFCLYQSYQTKCGNLIVEGDQQCDYFIGCTPDCKLQNQGIFTLKKRHISQNILVSQPFINYENSNQKYSLFSLIQNIPKAIKESGGLTSWPLKQIKYFFEINNVDYNPQENLQKFNEVTLLLKLFKQVIQSTCCHQVDLSIFPLFYYDQAYPKQFKYLEKVVPLLQKIWDYTPYILPRK